MIPHVDVGPWLDYRDRDVARQFDEALRDFGFLLITGHGIDQRALDKAREAAATFFHQPPEIKERVAGTRRPYRGWLDSKTGSASATYGLGEDPDLKETFSMGTEYSVAGIDDPGMWAPNIWPKDVPEMRLSWMELYRQMFGLSTELVRLCEAALDLPAGTMLQHHEGGGVHMVANLYPSYRAAGAESSYMRIGPHTDYGGLTLLDRRPSPSGLQILIDDEWVDAPYIPGSLTINIGDLMSHWVSGRWRSTFHRVPPPSADHPDEELLSVAMFQRPLSDTMIKPFFGEGEAIRCGDWFDRKVAASHLTKAGS